jgi:outer membrane lipoprotein carrier protein
MKIKWFSLIIILACSAAKAQATPADQLMRALENIKTFQAHFEQKIRDANGESVSNMKGEVIIQRPGHFYWKSHAPDPILVVADGHTLWTYDIELSQVTKQPLKETLRNSPAELLAGNVVKLTQSFKIDYAKPKQCNQKSDTCYLLQPKEKDAAFSNIIIGFTKDKLTEVKMHDPMGQQVNTIFSSIKINAPINKQVFAFKPPKGVDVINSGKDHD